MKSPVYLLAGGRPKNQNDSSFLVRTVLEGFGIPSTSIAYTGTANGDDTGFFKRIAAEFRRAGAGSVTHAVIDIPNADLAKASDILASADIVFVSGGDVDYGMQVLHAKNMANFLSELYRQGKPFFGISAGSIMLAERWVRWSDPEDGSTAELFSCLGFAPVICDCHDEDAGWEELREALQLEKVLEGGYGLVSGSGIRVAPDGSVEAIGMPVHRFLRRGTAVVRAEDIRPE
jgi:peptidase E